jgi:hypothetical protein
LFFGTALYSAVFPLSLQHGEQIFALPLAFKPSMVMPPPPSLPALSPKMPLPAPVSVRLPLQVILVLVLLLTLLLLVMMLLLFVSLWSRLSSSSCSRSSW